MLVDSHAHLNFQEFSQDWQQIISNCQKEDIWLINVGSQLATSRKAVEIAEQYEEGVYAAVGLHPIHVAGSSLHPEKFIEKEYRELVNSSKKVVAIGETGLDFYHHDKNIANQKKVFCQHLQLAKEFNLPIILHSRNSRDGENNAYEEILKILLEIRDQSSDIRGVIHCFGGSLKQALAFLKLGFFIGFTGVITFPKTDQLAAMIKLLPLERILVETDCPYLAPAPYRGQRNRPEYVKFVAQKIAEIKQVEYNKIEKQIGQNTIKLFNLPQKLGVKK